jgi:hypothetical protein
MPPFMKKRLHDRSLPKILIRRTNPLFCSISRSTQPNTAIHHVEKELSENVAAFSDNSFCIYFFNQASFRPV